MKRILCLMLCLCFLPVFAVAESVEDALVVGMLSTRTTQLTPLEPQERDMMSLYSLVYESLVTIDDKGVPQPLLCESWTETGDG
jgi:ABC-type oligopeptide transport system substrate-binding subunit